MRGQSAVFQALRATMAQEPQPPIPERSRRAGSRYANARGRHWLLEC
jgi:hypothetical protein